MDKKFRRIAAGITGILAVMLIFSSLVIASQVTIIGTVTEDYQLFAEDGTIYEIADTEMGTELLNHVGQKVEVNGTITEEDGVKIITVTSYTLKDS